jgi:branched-chain amino acid transport system substrate-binding protein
MGLFTKAQASGSQSKLWKILAIVGISALVLAGCSSSEDTSTGTSSSETSVEAEETKPEPVCEDLVVTAGAAPAQELNLLLGTALPQTGSLAFLGPPEEAGVALAARDINNAAKGVTVDIIYGDSGDNTNLAWETEIPRLLNAGVKAIIGAASSGVSLRFIDQVVGAGVIQFSPANTSAQFTTYDDNGLYFRTAPSDVLQGEVLGNLLAEDGNQTVGMIVLNDAYGVGLAKFTGDAFEAAGGTVVASETYNDGETNFTSQISTVLAANPDAIVLITFEEVKTILPELLGQFPADKLYFVDGNLANFGDAFPPGTLAGAKGTYPGLNPENISDFIDRMSGCWEVDGNAPLTEVLYGAESYDAVTLLALASLAAGSTESADIAAKLQEVSGGSGNGTKCFSFPECADIINGGGVADYDGPSGPITFNEVGDPTDGAMGVYIYQDDNTYVPFAG